MFGKGINTAELIRKDLETAKIDLKDKDGNEICFHSLRNSYISYLANSQTPAKVVQKLARHSDPRLTFNVYARTFEDAEQKAIENLPDFGEFCLCHLLGQNVQKTADFSGRQQTENRANAPENAVVAQLSIPSRGVEPIKENGQTIMNKEVIKSNAIDLSGNLDGKNQANLKKIIEAWPRLSEHIQRAILALVGVG